jgi:phosphatidylserine/phosphatidylglycerophosphate/cardiolipin synthase-like enzyme
VTGLSTAPTQDLKTLARAIERKTLRFPLTAARLRAAGVGRLVEHLPRLAGLSLEQAASLVECVLAERARSGGAALELVWTGPDVPETLVRDTAIVVRDLFASAQSSVLVGGCYFSGGEAILEPLYRGIKERGVQATVCLNIPEPASSAADIPGHVRRQVRAFIAKNWPFGMPLPRFYYDPRTVEPVPAGRSRILLHSKCVVVDERTAFITSANFTHNGQARNIETGVLIEDEKFAGELVGHWNTLIGAGLLLPHATTAADVAAGAEDHNIDAWNELRDSVPAEYLPLFDALKGLGLPPPSDALGELVWKNRVSDAVAWIYWETAAGNVGLIPPGAHADNLDGIEAAPDDEPRTIAAEIERRLSRATEEHA